MQGKIALEEHFAIPETLADSRGYFPDRVWRGDQKPRDGYPRAAARARWTSNGIEMMLLSLNAPAVQAIPDIGARRRDRAQGQRLSRRAGAASGRTAFRALPRCRCRIRRRRRANSSAA